MVDAFDKNIEIDEMNCDDLKKAHYMRDLIGCEDYEIDRLIQVSMREVFLKGFASFKLYRDEELYNKVNGDDYNTKYIAAGYLPFQFSAKTEYCEEQKNVTAIYYPKMQDKASYVFFGSKLHHALKDINPKEIIARNKVDEVIPMFYEMLCASEEMDKDISVEVLKRRLMLIQLDEKEEMMNETKQLQQFNSYYYAVALFNKYKKEEDKISMLHQISRVLKGEMSTLDLLTILDIYGSNLDYAVSCELDEIKEYIHTRKI